MFAHLKETWHRLRIAQPGQRFQDYHRHHQAEAHSNGSRVVSIVIGLVIVAVGIVALPAPGPGTLVIALGAAFIARESLVVARFIDWAELKLRSVWSGARSAWRRASPLKRVGATVVALGVVGAALYLAYTVTLRA